VQLYSALVYEGPGLVARIKRGLLNQLAEEKARLRQMTGRKAGDVRRSV
jgi:dihydroorotate dehydrogenase